MIPISSFSNRSLRLFLNAQSVANSWASIFLVHLLSKAHTDVADSTDQRKNLSHAEKPVRLVAIFTGENIEVLARRCQAMSGFFLSCRGMCEEKADSRAS